MQQKSTGKAQKSEAARPADRVVSPCAPQGLRDLVSTVRELCHASRASLWEWCQVTGAPALIASTVTPGTGSEPVPAWPIDTDVAADPGDPDTLAIAFPVRDRRCLLRVAGPDLGANGAKAQLRVLARVASMAMLGGDAPAPAPGAMEYEHPTPIAYRPSLAVETPLVERVARGIDDLRPILGRSRRLLEALDLLERVAPREIPVLLFGESGTGKELFARAVHQKSARRSGPFLAVNCGAMTGSLLESELFGYERGAFTGAGQTTKGLFEEACGGTLFLDEVHELTPAAQVSLLRVLQEGEVRRVGGKRPIPVNVRIVAASPVDLALRVEAKLLRSDLYYRLHVFPVHLPPLRDRPEDIPELVDHFLDRIASRERQTRLTLSPPAMSLLIGARWTGNIRELQSVVERAAAMARSGVIEAEDIMLPSAQRTNPMRQAASEGRTLEEVEMAYIIESLASNGNCRSRTARQLGISTNTLWRKLRQAGLVEGGSSGEREAAREDT